MESGGIREEYEYLSSCNQLGVCFRVQINTVGAERLSLCLYNLIACSTVQYYAVYSSSFPIMIMYPSSSVHRLSYWYSHMINVICIEDPTIHLNEYTIVFVMFSYCLVHILKINFIELPLPQPRHLNHIAKSKHLYR